MALIVIFVIFAAIFINNSGVVHCTFFDMYTKSVMPEKAQIKSFYDVLWNCFDSDGDVSSCLRTQVLYLLDSALKKDIEPILREPALKKIIGEELKEAEDDDEVGDDGENFFDDKHKDGKKTGKSVLLAGNAPVPGSSSLSKIFMKTIKSIQKHYFNSNSTSFEGRRKRKGVEHAITTAVTMGAFIFGPIILKAITLLTGKALLLSKIAVVLSVVALLKKPPPVQTVVEYEKRARDFKAPYHHHHHPDIHTDYSTEFSTYPENYNDQ